MDQVWNLYDFYMIETRLLEEGRRRLLRELNQPVAVPEDVNPEAPGFYIRTDIGMNAYDLILGFKVAMESFDLSMTEIRDSMTEIRNRMAERRNRMAEIRNRLLDGD